MFFESLHNDKILKFGAGHGFSRDIQFKNLEASRVHFTGWVCLNQFIGGPFRFALFTSPGLN